LFNHDLYTFDPVRENNGSLLALVKLNGKHAIFRGHFPDQPVLPGVCMLEMIREILEGSLQQKLRITGGPLIKFLSMIVPDKNPEFLVEINYEPKNGSIQANGKIFRDQAVFMKYSLVFTPPPA
jgi:3-hydroxyacyl-[acyl-carrier-protein] dehydratase